MVKLHLKYLPMNKRRFLLIVIFLLGFFVRVYHIEQVPPGLNRDEASIGYTAYSLLMSGKDEYGKSWPVSFKSFGDWKLPLYIYTTIPFVKLFGLTDIAVRLPSVLFGSFTIFIAYFLSRELFRGQGKNEFSLWMKKIPILSAFIFALSPWSIHLSRTGSEANFAVFFTSLGLLLHLRFNRNKWNILFGTFFLVLSLYIYHANHIFTLLLFLGLIVIYWRNYKRGLSFWVSIFIYIILSLFIYSQTLFTADKTKISGLFATSDLALVYANVTLNRLQHTKFPNTVASFFHNKLLYTAEYTIRNYIKSYSPEFLFINGGDNTQHNIPDFGNFYLWEAPFLLLGVAYLISQKNQHKNLLIYWLLIAPAAASITKDAPHTARMAVVMPLLEILIAYGFLSFIRIYVFNKKKYSYLSIFTLIILFIFNFAIWNDQYFIHFPQTRAATWGEGYTRLIAYLNQNGDFGASEVVMTRPEYSPYIYFLFYNKIDPIHFQDSVVRYAQTDEGFQHVAKFDNYYFRNIDWTDDLVIPNNLYIAWSDQVPGSATNSAVLVTSAVLQQLRNNNKDTSNLKIGDIVFTQKVGDIKLQNGDSMFTLIKTSKISTELN